MSVDYSHEKAVKGIRHIIRNAFGNGAMGEAHPLSMNGHRCMPFELPGIRYN